MAGKYEHVANLIEQELPRITWQRRIVLLRHANRPKNSPGVPRRQRTESRRAYHAKLPPETRRIRRRASLPVTTARHYRDNAAGMGIDKPDVRLVVHADAASSSKTMQEAGRAGARPGSSALRAALRDRRRSSASTSKLVRALASATSRAVLRALRQTRRRKTAATPVIATSGAKSRRRRKAISSRDIATDDTRVLLQLPGWRSRSHVRRGKRRALPLVSTRQKPRRADALLTSLILAAGRVILNLLQILMSTPADEGISTDELMNQAGITATSLPRSLYTCSTSWASPATMLV